MVKRQILKMYHNTNWTNKSQPCAVYIHLQRTSLKINISRTNKLAFFPRLFLYNYNLFSGIFILCFFSRKKIGVFSHIHSLHEMKKIQERRQYCAHSVWHHFFFLCSTHTWKIPRWKMPNTQSYILHTERLLHIQFFLCSHGAVSFSLTCELSLEKCGFRCEKDTATSLSLSRSVLLWSAYSQTTRTKIGNECAIHRDAGKNEIMQ